MKQLSSRVCRSRCGFKRGMNTEALGAVVDHHSRFETAIGKLNDTSDPRPPRLGRAVATIAGPGCLPKILPTVIQTINIFMIYFYRYFAGHPKPRQPVGIVSFPV